ncbi:helix-turn-helix domain-containing protein [Inquilinus sp. KBS0705]|nr:helix-turn-helix domain-containing protein [Inquilinus sp. KBS0705]
MKHITILAPLGQNNLSSIVGSYKILMRANQYWQQKGNRSLYNIQVAGVSDKVEYYDGLFAVKPHTHITDIKKTDLLLIPSLNHNYQSAIEDNQEMIDWIAAQYKNGAEVASVCTGGFLLAATGLLDGKSCSTHWIATDDFRTMFPKVQLQADKLITDENGIYTNGGAYSFLNLLIYLIEKKFDRDTAIYCAKVFQIEMDRQSQSAFIIFKGQKQHHDEMVKQAQTYIETNFSDKLSVEHLSARFAIGRRNFDRRFIKATGNTPVEYLQRVKIETAKRAFESNRKTINEVMYEVGYQDVKAFREVFRKITGMSPLEYKSKYNKEVVG